MKNLKRFALMALVATALVACKKDDDNNNGGNPSTEPADMSTLEGEIIANTTLKSGRTFFLKGGVHVKPGATLTIESGVTVKSDPIEPTPAYLLVEPGASINAQGTATSPIVFTSGSANPAPQDWGGIILCGRAPINPQGGTAASEMGVGVTYGGTNAADNSGTMRYVRVEYTGKKASNDKEHNGFTFEGVGNGTTIEYLAVYKGADDGFEWFGGTVNAKYLFSYGAQDDCFDWTYGWQGNGQFWVAVQLPGDADRGIEADNNGSNNSLSPFSSPKLSNLTFIGRKDAAAKSRAVKLREGTKGNIHNLVSFGFDSGIEIEHDQTITNLEDGSLTFANNNTHVNSGYSYKSSAGTSVTPTVTLDMVSLKNTLDLTETASYLNNTYKGVDNTSGNAVNPNTALGSWFTSVNFIGALDPSNDWTAGTWARQD